MVSLVRCLRRVSRRYDGDIKVFRLLSTVFVSPSDSQIQDLLNGLANPDLSKVMKKRSEPLQVPMYKLLTLEQLQEAQEEATRKAKLMLKTPPILPLRQPCGEVLEVDEDIAGATSHPIIFTEITQHKNNELRSIVVREPDGVLRQAKWEERDRMYQVFFPVHGQKMWLPKVLTDQGLPPVLDKMLHADVLDLTSVQCHPQSSDYHRIHSFVYEDIVRKDCYDLLRYTRYFGCLVWYLLTSLYPPRIQGLLKDMIERQLFENAEAVVKLFVLCYPEDSVTQDLASNQRDGKELIKVFCKLSNFPDLLPYLEDKEIVQQ